MSARSLARKVLNNGLGAVARYLPLPLFRLVLPRGPVGFFYHAVSDRPLPHVQHLYPIKTGRAFERDLVYLKEKFTPVGYDQLKAQTEGRRQLPKNAAFISFDDGFSVCRTVAAPLLKKHQVPAIFFLATDWIDNRAMYDRSVISLIIDKLLQHEPRERLAVLGRMSREAGNSIPASELQSAIAWLLQRTPDDRPLLDRICALLEIDIDAYLEEQQPFLRGSDILEIQAEGFTIGAHSRSHAKLMNLPPELQWEEIVESCRIVCELTGAEQVPFAFPFSGHRVDRGMLAELRRTHPHVGLIFDTRKLARDLPFIYNRIMVDRPVPGVPDDENLAHWLQDAYAGLVRR